MLISRAELKKLQLKISKEGEWSAAIVEELIKHKIFKTYYARDPGGSLYVYECGVYVLRGESRIRHLAKVVVSAASWTSKLADETVERIRADAPYLWERP